MQFVESQKGSKIAIYDGYKYRLDKSYVASQNWRCLKKTCNGRLVKRRNVEEPIVRGEHNHAPDIGENEVYVVKDKIRKMAENIEERPRSILQQCCQHLGTEATVRLPNYEALRQIIHRKRQSLDNCTTFTFHGGEVDEKYVKTLKGDNFLLYDSGKDKNNDRILLFGTNTNLSLLNEFKNWCIDGTFKIAPPLAQQVYTIHCFIEQKAVPLCYAILGNKRKETYLELFAKIKELQPNLNPDTLLCDFEMAAYTAFQDVYPETLVSGCFFHLSQNLWRQIQKVAGLVNLYKNNEGIRLKCKMLLALAFVPVRDVQFVHELLEEAEEDGGGGFQEELQPINEYWKRNYVGIRLQNVAPIFPIEMWNMHHRLNTDIPRSNNSLEAWHNSFLRNIDCHHPSMSKLLEKFQLEQSQTENFIIRYRAGFRIGESSKSVYYQQKKRLQRLAENYTFRNAIEYLKNIALHLSL